MKRSTRWGELIAAARGERPADDRASLLTAAVGLGLDVGPGVVACSITQKLGDGWWTPHSSAVLADRLDAAQYAVGDGPCVHAADTATVVRLSPIADAPVAYATFVAAAAAHSVRASLSVPVPDAREPTGVNLYATGPDAFDGRRPQQIAGLLARLCGALLAGSTGSTGSTGDAERPPASLPTWSAGRGAAAARRDAAVVDSALRTVQRTRGLARVEAHQWLMRRSVDQGRSMVELAREVVDPDGRGRRNRP